MSETAPAPADIRAALEDLRTADQILLGVLGTTQYLAIAVGYAALLLVR